LNNLDLIYALRAVTTVPGFTPATCSDRFDAMDSFPIDTDTVRGGDGLLNNLDLIRSLRRVTNIDTSRPVRMSRGANCTVSSSQFAVQSGRADESASNGPPAGILEFGAAESGLDGVRVLVYLRATDQINLSSLSLSLGIEGLEERLRFTSVDSLRPALVDDMLLGILALSWLSEINVPSAQTALLGYVELSASSGAPNSLRVFGLEANAADGSAVPLNSPALGRMKSGINMQ